MFRCEQALVSLHLFYCRLGEVWQKKVTFAMKSQRAVVSILWMRYEQNMTDDHFDIRDSRPNEMEREFEKALRPLTFDDFSGQEA